VPLLRCALRSVVVPVPLPETVPGHLRLYLVRHGRTRYNEQGLMQGWSDSPLTDDGLAEVRAMADALADTPFAAAYCSPSPRTVTTAEEILRHHPGVRLVRDAGLREMHFGDHEARPEADLFGTLDPWTMFGEVFEGSFPGLPGSAEDGRAYRDRVGTAFGRIEASRDDGAPVLVVGHGVTLLTYLYSAVDAEIVPLGNATLSVLEIDRAGRRRLRAMGLAAEAVPALADLDGRCA
jgi:probable phosphoglycerate mutase